MYHILVSERSMFCLLPFFLDLPLFSLICLIHFLSAVDLWERFYQIHVLPSFVRFNEPVITQLANKPDVYKQHSKEFAQVFFTGIVGEF